MRRRLPETLAVAALAVPTPIIAGEFPDPTGTKTHEGDYVAVTTGGPWAPSMRVHRSPDMAQWRLTGAVFPSPPAWVKKNFWAPEIIKLANGYALYYSALPRRRKTWFCLGVAFAPTPEGPWGDLGRPLRCGRNGSIDPFPVRDENGRLHLLWKADGNEFKRPTQIFVQPLSENGAQLLGTPTEVIRNDRRWEGRVVEAPAVVRRPDGFFYLLYSGNLCCQVPCRYAVGAARAPRLTGPWTKFDGNPILRGGRGWACPGHTGLLDDDAGGLTALFHAYRGGRERLAGRQVLAAPMSFRADGWPQIGDGQPPAAVPGAAETQFSDSFAGRLAPEWEWPLQRPPAIATGAGLSLGAPGRMRGGKRLGDRLDGAVLARRTGTGGFTATAVIDRATLSDRAMGGLGVYRNDLDAIGVVAGRSRVFVWVRDGGRGRRLTPVAAPGVARVHLRMVADGRRYRFQVSGDGEVWRPVGGAVRGPIDESARLALTAGGEPRARVRFASASLAELPLK